MPEAMAINTRKRRIREVTSIRLVPLSKEIVYAQHADPNRILLFNDRGLDFLRAQLRACVIHGVDAVKGADTNAIDRAAADLCLLDVGWQTEQQYAGLGGLGVVGRPECSGLQEVSVLCIAVWRCAR